MKKVATIITSASIIVLVLMACSSNNKAAIADNSKDTTAVRINDGTPDTSSIKNSEGELGDGTNGQSLNDIRFANFSDDDWLDNEYIRTLRKYINDYNDGKIKDNGLDPYKEKVRGKFVVWKAEPFLLGGLFIQFVFIDSSDDIFSSWVYSDVDEGAKSITGYTVHGVKMEEDKSGFTKERILEIVEQEDNLKLF